MQKRNGRKQAGSASRATPKSRAEGAVRRLARVVDAALKDADAARTHAFDPEFKRGLGQDRRATCRASAPSSRRSRTASTPRTRTRRSRSRGLETVRDGGAL